MTAPLLEAVGLHKRFGAQVVLERIDLAIEAGRLQGIMGPNGAGKTTCFNVLTGRYRPDRGKVVLAGRDITGLPPWRIAGLGIARSFQIMSLFDQMTALENVVVALPATRARLAGWTRPLLADAAAADRGMAVLASVGLAAQALQPAKILSYGERRALEIGLALAGDPRLLFLDEPTAGLGTEGTARLLELVQELKRKLTIVMIEHDMRFLFKLADRIAVIHWGQVIASGTPAELSADPWVARSDLAAPEAA